MNGQQMEVLMARSLIDIGLLDLRVQEQVAKHGNVKDFSLALWKQEPDSTGCNWNARIERTRTNGTGDPRMREVVPEMRRSFNLK
jgi:hypothetical protein